MNICNISYADMPTCVTNVGQSVSDHNGTDGLNWFSVSYCGLSMLRQGDLGRGLRHLTVRLVLDYVIEAG